ncbi:beta-galactosidase [uncultured Pseudokineococcus sp.]|uniref:beta-galactosidase n=1 Tax=uncultured Pseudokineococcus sp. TaxID=1642928 RepID=UPI00262FBD09|nr:beta-galactosidase [uncultured Pseudokineococcus sp.]
MPSTVVPTLDRLAFGGDYNPEQWPEEVQEEDVRLMVEAGVTMVTVGVFSWALLEPEEGRYETAWLRRVLDRLHEAGIRVDLATPSASPPPWFASRYPESLPMTRDGVRLGIGAREHYCASSPDYRRAAQALASHLAGGLGDHPALALWHIGNEFGAQVGQCFCPVSEEAFRRWLQERYGDLDALNRAWGTAFWSQRYGAWEHVRAPRVAPMPVNPAQQLDYRRFSSDEHLACYRGERDAVRAHATGAPVTTNFMATTSDGLDYWRWAPEVDVVTNDHYLTAEAERPHVGLAMSADVTRGLAGGGPWLLLEHSTSAVNWQPRNVAKRPGEMRRNALAHVARGSDGAMFFQWRASRSGAEKFHSAMVPHAGEDSDLFRDVVALGADLGRLAEVAGSVVVEDVAMVWDWPSRWALELEFRPTVDLRYAERAEATYEALHDLHRTVAVVPPDADPERLARFPVLVLPQLYLVTDEAAAGLRAYVEGGGHLVVPFFSGVVDATDRVPEGPYPGQLRDLLGLDVEEWHPLRAGERVALSGDGDDAPGGPGGPVGDVWSERVRPRGAQVRRTFAEGPDAGHPAVTRHDLGAGAAWYVATRLRAPDLRALLAEVLAAAGVAPRDLPHDLEVVRRRGDGVDHVFALNHAAAPARLPEGGTDLLTGAHHDGAVDVPAGGAVVLRVERSS